MRFGDFMRITGFSFAETERRFETLPDSKRCQTWWGTLFTPIGFDLTESKLSNVEYVDTLPDIDVCTIAYEFNGNSCVKTVAPEDVEFTKAWLRETLHVGSDKITVGAIETLRRTKIVVTSGSW